MSYLHWSSDLETGIEDIDKQHQRLVDYLNDLSTANENGDRTAMLNVLNNLVHYTKTHFTYEEELLERANYPFLRAHKRVHDIFAQRVGDFQQRAIGGENVGAELLSMLKIWLVNHIKGDDADYAESVRKMLGIKHAGTKVAGGWLGTALHKLFE